MCSHLPAKKLGFYFKMSYGLVVTGGALKYALVPDMAGDLWLKIGIGISGKEGMQAFMASDYAYTPVQISLISW